MVATLTELEPLPAEEFLRRLEEIRATHSVMNTDFIKEFVAGNIPLHALKQWSCEWFYFTRRTAPPTILKPYGYRWEDDEIVLTSADNSLQENGWKQDPPHPYLARELCYGLGLGDEEIEAAEVLPSTYWYTEYANSVKGRADTLNAAVSIALEGDSAFSAQAIADALRDKYGISDQAAIYWTTHAYADTGHKDENAEILIELCTSRAMQEQVMERARTAIQTRNRAWGSWRSLW